MAIDIGVPSLALESYLKQKALSQEHERAQQLHDQAQETLKEISKHHASQLDIQKKQLQLSEATLREHLKQQFIENVAGGKVDPNMASPSMIGDQLSQGGDTGNPSGGISQPTVSPTGGAVPVSQPAPMQVPQGGNPSGAIGPLGQAQTQAQIMQLLGPLQAKQAGAVAGAQEQAKIGAQNTDVAQQVRLKEHEIKSQELAQQGVQAKELENIRGNFATGWHKIMAASAANVAHIQNDIYSDPDVVKGAVNDMLAGTAEPSTFHPKTRLAATRAFEQMGWRLPDNKHAQDLNGYRAAEDLLSQILPLINDYSRDGEKGGVVALGKSALGFGDLRANMDSIQAKAAQLANVLDPKARVLKGVLQDQIKGIIDPKLTREQNMMKFNSAVQSINSGITSQFAGYPKDQVAAEMGVRGIHLFGDTKQSGPPKVNAKGHKLNEELTKQYGRPVYE